MASESFNKLKTYLRDIFQYNENDLDFGIYKILKLKRNEVENFIEGEEEGCLQKIIEETLSEVQSGEKDTYYQIIKNFIEQDVPPRKQKSFLSNLDTSLEELKGIAEEAKPENLTEVLRAIDAIQSYEPDTTNEDQIYNYILNFFELYYNNGDFGYNDRSLARFKVEYDEDYDGSDVMFHWKHKDSYYIKSANDFTNVSFEINGKRIEYRVEGFDATEGSSQNNNKENKLKHYKFIEISKSGGIHKVVFKLSDKSTPKAEIYSKILAEVFKIKDTEKYLFKKDEKSIFNDLIEKYDKIISGQVQGLKSLKLDRDKYLEHLADREEFRELGSNKTKRVEELEKDETANLLLSLDKNLNKFYIGNDSDFFIHKDLKKFLTKEKEKFIKNVIYSNIEVLLDNDRHEKTRRIAKSFNKVIATIIEFLDAIETFQKNLFTMKKKVVQTNYLISVDKIPAEFHEEILANEAQITEFKETFNINLDDRLFKLELYPTLVVDTKYFSDDFKDRLLSKEVFENLDDKITGVLINSDNFQALVLLENLLRGRTDLIYIDPPYNAKSSEIIYKNSFKHSSWLSMMNNSLIISRKLLMEDGIIEVAIDDYEAFNLKNELDIVYGQDNFISNICVVHNPRGRNDDKFFGTSHEYMMVYAKNISDAEVKLFEYTEADAGEFPLKDDISDYGLVSFMRTGNNSDRIDRPNLYYPIYFDPTNKEFSVIKKDDFVEILPINTSGREKTWRWQKETFLSRCKTEIEIKESDGEFRLYKKRRNNEGGKKAKTIWIDPKYDASSHGIMLLNNYFGSTSAFSYPKSINTVFDAIYLTTDRNSLVLDYFAGSGTTGHAVIKLNKQDNGNRRAFLIEMGEYFDTILKERIKRVMFSENWKDGKPKIKEIDGYKGIVKYQKFEQYEDVLNNLKSDNEKLPKSAPVKYLFRLQEKEVRSSLDLSLPFDNKIIYGKENTEGIVDVCETYIYLKGYKVNSIKTYNHSRKKYKVYHTPNRLVIWRNIKEDEDDSPFIKELITKYSDINSIDVNYHIDKRKVKTPKPYIITNADFDGNASWS